MMMDTITDIVDKMTKYKTIKNRFITEFIEKYSDDSNRHFIQVMKKWRDFEK